MNLLRIGVGIAVVAVAVAIGFAVVAGRGEEARRMASARNLQQWGIALTLHLMDNQNQLPDVGSTPIEASQKGAWYNALPPYISQTPLAELPPGQRPKPGEPSLWMDPLTKPVRVWDPDVFYFNYGMNAALQPDPKLRSFRIFEIPHPGNVVFLAEVDGYAPDVTPETVAYRHGGVRAANPNALAQVLFCDGHVQAVNRATLTDNPLAREAATAENGVSWFMQ
jgi:prepilin-type processing-associated H-X9-DG protein